jgi:apolipoprotein N-acyltransferase
MTQALPRFFLGGASGLLLVLSLPKPDLYPLAWIALVPVLYALARAHSWVQAASVSYAAGLVYMAGTCYWIGDTMTIYGGLSFFSSMLVGLLFVFVLALYFALFGASVRALSGGRPLLVLALAPAVWVVMEFLRTHVPFGGFPWMLAGYALTPFTGLLQIASWTGIYGLSFVAVAINGLVAAAVLRRSIRLGIVAALAVGALSLIPVMNEDATEENLHVRLVQTNLAFEQSWQPSVAEPLMDELQSLSRITPSGGQSRLIVWPESSGPFFFDEDAGLRARMERVAESSQAYFIFGFIGEADSRPTNSAAMLGPQGERVSRYDKMHLVPFGEYVPLRNAFSFAESLLQEAGNFSPGKEYTVSAIGSHRISTAICYESIFPGLVREFVRRGSELLVVITNDEWFGESSAPHQHLRMAVVRAVENRRFVVRAANTGISAIIDPYGRIRARTSMYVRTALEGSVSFRSEKTFYTLYGDVFAWLNAMALAAFAVYRQFGRASRREVEGISNVRRT